MELEERHGVWTLANVITFEEGNGIHTYHGFRKRRHLILELGGGKPVAYETNNMGGWCGIGSFEQVTISWPKAKQ